MRDITRLLSERVTFHPQAGRLQPPLLTTHCTDSCHCYFGGSPVLIIITMLFYSKICKLRLAGQMLPWFVFHNLQAKNAFCGWVVALPWVIRTTGSEVQGSDMSPPCDGEFYESVWLSQGVPRYLVKQSGCFYGNVFTWPTFKSYTHIFFQ